MVDWLSHLDLDLKQSDLYETREEGTGEWLLEEPKFKEWLDGNHRVLWCAGDRTFHCASGVIFTDYSVLTRC
jgi:hypothetical protein